MNKNNFYLSFGIWLIIVTQLGVPGTWMKILVFISGLFLILVSLGPTILRKLQVKPKQRKKQNKINFQGVSSQDIKQNEEPKFSAQENSQIEAETKVEAEKET
jgi:hypothetical protein